MLSKGSVPLRCSTMSTRYLPNASFMTIRSQQFRCNNSTCSRSTSTANITTFGRGTATSAVTLCRLPGARATWPSRSPVRAAIHKQVHLPRLHVAHLGIHRIATPLVKEPEASTVATAQARVVARAHCEATVINHCTQLHSWQTWQLQIFLGTYRYAAPRRALHLHQEHIRSRQHSFLSLMLRLHTTGFALPRLFTRSAIPQVHLRHCHWAPCNLSRAHSQDALTGEP